MGKYHRIESSSTAATPRVGDEERYQKHEQDHKAPNPTVIYGPITRELHDHLEQEQGTKEHDGTTTPSKQMVNSYQKLDHKQHSYKQLMQEAKGKYRTDSKSKTKHRLLVSVDIILTVILLIRLLPFKPIATFFQELWGELSMSHVVGGSSTIETDPWNITAMPDANFEKVVIKYARMTFFPFLVFVPSLVVLSAAIISVTVNDTKTGIKRTLAFMSFATAGLFIFMSAMVACAETSKWILLGAISCLTPVILMLLARLSVACAAIPDGYADILSWFSKTVKCSQHFALKVAILLGFIFVFIPFLASFFCISSPPYLLAVPVSSLATCSVAGVFGMSMASIIIGLRNTHSMLTKLFHVYSSVVQRQFTVLLFLTCIALMMTTRQVMQIPSYM